MAAAAAAGAAAAAAAHLVSLRTGNVGQRNAQVSQPSQGDHSRWQTAKAAHAEVEVLQALEPAELARQHWHAAIEVGIPVGKGREQA